MKKIIVISDSHNNPLGLSRLYPIMNEADYIISLGDTVSDHFTLKNLFGDKLIAVKGNCDNNGLPDEKLMEIEGAAFFITHGNNYHVKSSLIDIISKAKELKANVVLYGHTHNSDIEDLQGIKFINPGCLRSGGGMSYCYIVVLNGMVMARIVNMV